MNLNTIDLNLLKVFQALQAERSVTRAGKRIGLSQPAMSNALGRLRYALKDELFVRGPGGMEPTVLAGELAAPISQILAETERVFSRDAPFYPAASRRTFKVGLVDIGSAILHLRLAQVLDAEAPSTRFRARQISRSETLEVLDRSEVDLVVGARSRVPSRLSVMPVFEEPLVVVARRGHPTIDRRITLDSYVRAAHILVSSTGMDTGHVDMILAKKQLKREVHMTVPHYLEACLIVAGSDLIVTLPRRIAKAFASGFDIALFEPPVDMPSIQIDLLWHRRSDGEPGHRWFRERLAAIASEL